MSKLRPTIIALVLITAWKPLVAQDSTRVEFDVVSIKRNVGSDTRNLIRTQPDGTFTAINTPIALMVAAASPVPIYRGEYLIGLPDWTRVERYDISVKAPAGWKANADQQRQMWRALFA